jgi:hypothetical protein
MFKKQLENKLNTLHQLLPDTDGQSSFEVEFVSNFQVQKKFFFSINFFIYFSRLYKQVSEIHLVMYDHHPKRLHW